MRPEISAHRCTVRENFERSIATGAELVEFDVRRTNDGEYVVYHEAITASGTFIADTTFKDLQRELGGTLVRVDEVFTMLAGRTRAHIDLKEAGYETDITRLGLDALGAEGFIMTTLIDESARSIKEFAPEANVALSLGLESSGHSLVELVGLRWSELFPLQRLRWCKADWVATQYQLAILNVLRVAAAHGIRSMVWTVNSECGIRHFLRDPRVDVLITDRPERALQMRKRMG